MTATIHEERSTDEASEDSHFSDEMMLLWWYDDHTNLRAAAHHDPSAMEDLLQQSQHLDEQERQRVIINAVYFEGDHNGPGWDSVLLHAISHGRTQNVAFLLEHGADPNGIEARLLDRHAERFRRFSSRFRPSSVDRDAASQVEPLTIEDMGKRSTNVAKFWYDVNAIPLEDVPNGSKLHSLVMAARHADVEIIDMLMDAGADSSFWRWNGPDAPTLTNEITASSRTALTPLHGAVDARDTKMLMHLLQTGFNPNGRALITGSQALTPWQHAICHNNIEAFSLLTAHPLADTSLTTPVLGIHVLHFAVAQLRMDLIQAIGLPLSKAPATALGHTLLHVACLPLDDHHAQLLAPKVLESIHDMRTLDPELYPGIVAQCFADSKPIRRHEVPLESRPLTDGPGDAASSAVESRFRHALPLEQRKNLSRHLHGNIQFPEPDPRESFHAQIEVAKHLVAALGEGEIAKTDVYGNTPLHYLAGARVVNDDLISWMRRSHQPLGDDTWTTKRNRWGWTPADLWYDNVITIEPRLEDVLGPKIILGPVIQDTRPST